MSDDEVTITLPREQLEAVVLSMEWDLPNLGDQSERAQLLRLHSERCFAASRQIHEALGHRMIPGTIERTA